MFKNIKHIALVSICFFYFQPSSAYNSFLNTGEILPQGQFMALGYLESVFDEFDGVNLNARGSMSVSDELQVDVEVGTGEFDLMLAGFIKWVPIPDYDQQPAIGARAGISYIKLNDFTETSVSLAPFTSKAFETDAGPFVPFIALPLGINSNSGHANSNDDDTFFSAKIAAGTEWTNPNWDPNLKFIGEISIELSHSFNSFNLGSSYRF